MDHFAGLDVSVKETSVCIVDDTGKIVREVKVASEPDALLPANRDIGLRHARAYRNAHVDQNKVPNNLLVNEPSLSTQGIGGSSGR